MHIFQWIDGENLRLSNSVDFCLIYTEIYLDIIFPHIYRFLFFGVYCREFS